MFALYAPELVYVHVSKETQERMTPDQKTVFEHLVVGVNVISLECYETVAKAVLKIPQCQVRKITRTHFVKRYLREDFVDHSGRLV